MDTENTANFNFDRVNTQGRDSMNNLGSVYQRFRQNENGNILNNEIDIVSFKLFTRVFTVITNPLG